MPTQTAVLRASDGTSTVAQVPAFPDNPELVEIDGRYYIANTPVIGYGSTSLAYHEAEPYDAGG
jgi:hypothetical protein